MTLAPGTRLGVYEVVGPLGSGGMGEVYRAHDTRLHRDVALKVLPAAMAADPDRLARFGREAQTLAALNHPNIATIHGLEEFAGGTALVMELVPGEDLSAIIGRRALPMDDAVSIARQIAEALEAAHDLGIVHRDLKPANVKVRPDGTVKVLDFGLAKAWDRSAASASGDIANSPTLTAHATALGIIIGTAAYMAPEQARGKAVDKRADIWAFGVVVYEMFTGSRLFAGDEASDVLAAVLRQPIDLATLPSATPSRVRHLVARCLERDVRQRLRDIGEARIALTAPDQVAPVAQGGFTRRDRRMALPWLLACGVCLVGGAALAWWVRGPSPRSPSLRLAVAPPVSSLSHVIRVVRISPDGRRLVYWDEASPELLVRDLDSFESRVLAGTEGGRMPFFSPDGEWVGFYAEGKLRKVPVKGGDAVAICDAPTESPGADWAPDGTIYFSPTWTAGLWKVSSAGGQPSQVTTPDRAKGETAHFWPRVLPDGKRMVFTIFGGEGLADSKLALLDTETGHVTELVPGSRPVYLGAGRLAYFHGGGYHVVAFDEATGRINGAAEGIREPVRPLERIGSSEYYLDAARGGRVVYVPGDASRGAPYSRLVWFDRHGLRQELPFADYHKSLALAPDQRRAAVTRSGGGEFQIWMYDLERGTADQLTREGTNFDPEWSPDSNRVAYTSLLKGTGSFDLRWSPADGSGAPSVILATDQDEFDWRWLPDGRTALFTTIAPRTGKDIRSMIEGRPDSLHAVIATAVDDELAEVSPDGRFLVWVSAGTLYAARYPTLSGRVQLAVHASVPHWSSATSEVIFIQDGHLAAVPFQVRGETITAGMPVTLFAYPRGPTDPSYSVSKDGQRFLMLENDATRETAEEIRVLDSLP